MLEKIDTIIVGGGQAGLAISYHLKQRGLEHVILEQADQIAEVWRNRWDSFTLITPNWMVRLPGAEYEGNHPDDFMARDDVVDYLEEYVEKFELPIRYGHRVISIQSNDVGYVIKTDKGDIKANNAVVATGMYQMPKTPKFHDHLSHNIDQLHSSDYRNPEVLPEGGVLVVGSAQSGAQIAEELYQSGRNVYLSVSNAGRFPRRYRGKDITCWLDEMGFEITADELPSSNSKFEGSSHGTGKDGGHTINLHQFARDGVVLLGRIDSAQKDKIFLAPNLKENLAKADETEANLVNQVDEYIKEKGLVVPIEILPELRDGYKADLIHELDLKSVGITNVIWATGYKFDFSIVNLPVFDEDGYPVQKRGVTEYPGLYFIGLPYLHNSNSGTLFGVGDDAKHVASEIVTRGK